MPIELVLFLHESMTVNRTSVNKMHVFYLQESNVKTAIFKIMSKTNGWRLSISRSLVKAVAEFERQLIQEATDSTEAGCRYYAFAHNVKHAR